MTGEPRRTDCVRLDCGHSSDVHFFWGAGPISVTDATLAFPCRECDCPTMIRSAQNYAELIEGQS